MAGKSITVNNALHENELLLNNAHREWIDGVEAEKFTPSIHGKTFQGFPYTLIIDEDGDLTWEDGIAPVEKGWNSGGSLGKAVGFGDEKGT